MANTEPWNIKTKDSREADRLTTFIIYCEDDNSEPIYFRSLSSPTVKINAIPNQKSGKLNLINAIDDCVNEKRAIFSDNKYQVVQELVELIWCVYDRDMENEKFEDIPNKNHTAFDLAIQTATDAGLNIAWSNDAFELWILLHFEDVPLGEILHRSYIYNRLTELFRTIEPRTVELDLITNNEHFNYKNSFKKRDHFINFVLPLLSVRRDDAIDRARAIEIHFKDSTKPFHKRNPCTLVHHLVERIISP